MSDDDEDDADNNGEGSQSKTNNDEGKQAEKTPESDQTAALDNSDNHSGNALTDET